MIIAIVLVLDVAMLLSLGFLVGKIHGHKASRERLEAAVLGWKNSTEGWKQANSRVDKLLQERAEKPLLSPFQPRV